MKGKVLLAMSGGLDSSVAALMLLQEGYEVVGVTYRTWDSVSQGCWEKETGCCTIDAIMEAKDLANKLGFEHHIIDFRDEFKKIVITDFINEYLSGRTPNPCVVCNAHIKWGVLEHMADELGCHYIATGHYARIRFENGRYVLAKGIDYFKDQSYFLWRLSQECLSRTLFPLGNYFKSEVREFAYNQGYERLAKKQESQEICSIPDNDYKRFLLEEAKEQMEKIGEGDIVTTSGILVGKHKGYPFYTIGQRKGLDIAMGIPMYVTHINTETNTLTVGEKHELLGNTMKVSSINMVKYPELNNELTVETKIRYRSKVVGCKISVNGDNLFANFAYPVYSVTPGQSAVFYEGDDVVVGGIIEG